MHSLREQRLDDFTQRKRVLYEQVTGVKRSSLFFLFSGSSVLCSRCAACCSPPGLYSHSLDEPFVIEARCRLGFERRVDAAISQTALEGQNAHVAIGTRYRRNGYSSCD